MTENRLIRVRGARTHNLKNLNLDLPRDQLVVITGLSGSGKSSLAFDTLYAEGQRRYVESLSAYARQFLELMARPDVDLIEGLSPAIAIEQKAGNHNPRSTVGTVTEILDYLRLLFARAGTAHCPNHPEMSLAGQSLTEMVDGLMRLPSQTKLILLAPVAGVPLDGLTSLLDGLRAQGFTRVRLRGPSSDWVEHRLDDPLPSLTDQAHEVQVVIDRVRVRQASHEQEAFRQRLAESLETAMRVGQDKAVVCVEPEANETAQSASDATGQTEQTLSQRLACPHCGFSIKDLEPTQFSFNAPAGACPSCDGLGEQDFFDPELVVAFPHLSLASGAIVGWDARNPFAWSLIQSLAQHAGFSVDEPFEDLTEAQKDLLLYGSGDTPVSLTFPAERGKPTVKQQPFEGIIPNLARRWRETDNQAVREEIGRFRRRRPCPDCNGSRLGPLARAVRLGDGEAYLRLPELLAMPLDAADRALTRLELKGGRQAVAERLLAEVRSRLGFLINVGLAYLSLDRAATGLSGGESQRIRLASQIGAGLSGVMYVLDEPSIGLHQRDNDRLLGTLRHLRDLGNAVIVVEHDEDAIRTADYVVDMGPGAGTQGGEIIAQGSPQEVMAHPKSLTGAYLSGRLAIAVPSKRRAPDGRWLRICGARGHNLRIDQVDIPVGCLVCVTGVSGSGKSTLINDTLVAAAASQLNGAQSKPAPHESIEGLEAFDRLIDVDQSPIGRTPRSNPATYTGLFTTIRELFAGSAMARERGYDSGRFSFNVKGGRCEACQGDGLVKVEMHFLPDLYVPCDLCHGLRYNRETLDVRYRGKNISEVLDLTVEDALAFFSAVPNLARRLDMLREVGLGYIRLGQSATTLSGGEAQRIKLACELAKRDTGRTLYVLDEPTTGLHFQDIDLLLRVLFRLRDQGNTVIIIEHNLDVI
ncbi:MAG: excinuclease ABC subunit UvrA, partial [Betaproteobacteria bacterium]|nr:excinuclease ABC subunit UvrA [Betaproteobacteria bacterium]